MKKKMARKTTQMRVTAFVSGSGAAAVAIGNLLFIPFDGAIALGSFFPFVLIRGFFFFWRRKI